jgi:hypothetical protein
MVYHAILILSPQIKVFIAGQLMEYIAHKVMYLDVIHHRESVQQIMEYFVLLLIIKHAWLILDITVIAHIVYKAAILITIYLNFVYHMIKLTA